jgi:hypothetical protein
MNSTTKSNLISLGILLGLTLMLIKIANYYVLTLNFYDNSGEYLSGVPEREHDVYDALQRYIYLSAIAYTVLKLFLITLIIHTALYLAGQQMKFGRALNIVIFSEYVFLLSVIIKIIWFKIEYPAGILADWHKISILSMLSLFKNATPDWYYPLQTFNLFEIAYWFILAYGIKRATSLTYDQSIKIVVSSYVPALFIWVSTVAFCTVMVFPQNA